MAPPRTEFLERFWSKVDKSGGPEACWPWLAYKNQAGYGLINVGFQADGTFRKEIASRVSYELTNGPLKPGEWACHKCDNPPCVNPAHLFAGDNSANQRDARAKGRFPKELGYRRASSPRKTHCLRGHPLSGDNLILKNDGTRKGCRECAREKAHEWYLAHLEQARAYAREHEKQRKQRQPRIRTHAYALVARVTKGDLD